MFQIRSFKEKYKASEMILFTKASGVNFISLSTYNKKGIYKKKDAMFTRMHPIKQTILTL